MAKTDPIALAQQELNKNPEALALAPIPQRLVLEKSTGDWAKDQRLDYTAGFIPPKPEIDMPGYFYGPTDAFVWIGLPYEGCPWKTFRIDAQTGKKFACETWFDDSNVTKEVFVDGNTIAMKWIAWDGVTRCNVYQRMEDTV